MLRTSSGQLLVAGLEVDALAVDRRLDFDKSTLSSIESKNKGIAARQRIVERLETTIADPASANATGRRVLESFQAKLADAIKGRDELRTQLSDEWASTPAEQRSIAYRRFAIRMDDAEDGSGTHGSFLMEQTEALMASHNRVAQLKSRARSGVEAIADYESRVADFEAQGQPARADLFRSLISEQQADNAKYARDVADLVPQRDALISELNDYVETHALSDDLYAALDFAQISRPPGNTYAHLKRAVVNWTNNVERQAGQVAQKEKALVQRAVSRKEAVLAEIDEIRVEIGALEAKLGSGEIEWAKTD